MGVDVELAAGVVEKGSAGYGGILAEADLDAELVDEVGGLVDFVEGLSGESGEDVGFEVAGAVTGVF